MPGAEALGGGSPEIRSHADQAPLSLGYDPSTLDPVVARAIDPELRDERVEDMAHELMQNSGHRLTLAEARAQAAENDDFIANVARNLIELQSDRQ